MFTKNNNHAPNNNEHKTPTPQQQARIEAMKRHPSNYLRNQPNLTSRN